MQGNTRAGVERSQSQDHVCYTVEEPTEQRHTAVLPLPACRTGRKPGAAEEGEPAGGPSEEAGQGWGDRTVQRKEWGFSARRDLHDDSTALFYR